MFVYPYLNTIFLALFRFSYFLYLPNGAAKIQTFNHLRLMHEIFRVGKYEEKITADKI